MSDRIEMAPDELEAARQLRDVSTRCRSGDARAAVAIVVVAGLAGLAVRSLFLARLTNDAIQYLLWFHFVCDHGIGALGDAFTNYTPSYSYLLMIAACFKGLAPPLSLVKAISIVFDLGCALVAAELVWTITRRPLRVAAAFAAVWLAPTMVLNSASWGQADSIWTFFTLLSVSLFLRRRNGTASFAVAFAVKAQAVFLGPFVLGMILRRRSSLAWLLVIPAIYLLLALPVFLAGRPLSSVLQVYLGQAETFHSLSMNAANIWVFAAAAPYQIGVAVGFALAGAVGLALALFIARSEQRGPVFMLLAACCSLFSMPYLLPKMHDRYFYAFEITAICLACIELRYLSIAAIAQVDGLLTYLAYDPAITTGVLPAAFGNAILGVFLVVELRRGVTRCHLPAKAWLGFAGAVSGLAVCVGAHGTVWARPYPVAVGLVVASMINLLRASLRPDIPGKLDLSLDQAAFQIVP